MSLLSLDVFPSLIGHGWLAPLEEMKMAKGVFGFFLLSKGPDDTLPTQLDTASERLPQQLPDRLPQGKHDDWWESVGPVYTVSKLVSLCFSIKGVAYSPKDIQDKIYD